MIGLFKQDPWFEDFSDRSVVFTRWTHDDDPSESYPVVIIHDPEAPVRAKARKLGTVGVITADFAPDTIAADRMPDGAVVMALRSSLDDALAPTCAKTKVKANLLATQTGGGARHYFLMTDSLTKLEAATKAMALPSGVTLHLWERENLPALLDWLKPDRWETWAARDAEVRAVFSGRGDDGSAHRDTRFFFLGGASRRLAEAAAAVGFAVEASDDVVILSKAMPITADALTALNRVFSEWVDAFEVDYDGWEAALLVKN